MNKKIFRFASVMLVCIILGVLLALQMKSVNSRELTVKNVQALQQQVLDYQKKNELLSSRNDELNQYVQQLEKNTSQGGESAATIKKELSEAQAFAGLSTVKSDGIVITLTPTGNTSIRDSVLRLFVNELCSLGASAISLNDQRKVAMTEIRATGSAIVVNGKTFSRQQPFTIKAILPADKKDYNLNYLEKVKQLVLDEYREEQQKIEVYFREKIEIPSFATTRDNQSKAQ